MKYRSIFLSDIHLGFHGCKAKELNKWLKQQKCEYLFLLGDIIDIWALRGKFYWPEAHTQLLRTILKVAKKTTLTVYTPGNHDWVLKNEGVLFDNILVANEHIHELADGRKFLCLHGDKHDDILLHVSTKLSQLRSYAGRVHWSLSKYLKQKVKSAVNYISNYEETVVNDAKQHGVDGVICGHIHHAVIQDLDGVTYVNCGDMVESLTVVVETFEGELKILDLTKLI
jgi:UDP-2,3-diacylglucosamine pyrophosphatase LpxH